MSPYYFLQFAMCVLAVTAIGCGPTEQESAVPQWNKVTQKERLDRFHSQQPFTFTVYHPSRSDLGESEPIHEVSETSIEDEVRKLDWVNTEQEVVLDCRRGKLTVRGYTNAPEEWFQLHLVSLEYGQDGNTIRYSRNLAGEDEVVEVLTSFFRDDGKWKTMLTWSDQMRPIPTRLLPKRMRENPERGPSAVRVEPDRS